MFCVSCLGLLHKYILQRAGGFGRGEHKTATQVSCVIFLHLLILICCESHIVSLTIIWDPRHLSSPSHIHTLFQWPALTFSSSYCSILIGVIFLLLIFFNDHLETRVAFLEEHTRELQAGLKGVRDRWSVVSRKIPWQKIHKCVFLFFLPHTFTISFQPCQNPWLWSCLNTCPAWGSWRDWQMLYSHFGGEQTNKQTKRWNQLTNKQLVP